MTAQQILFIEKEFLHHNMKDYTKLREIRTGYILSQAEINKLSDEEKIARKKQMLESREEIRRLKLLEEEL